jgi:hypothetical protein
VKYLLVFCALAGCGTFEDPNVVIDLRILAMTADPPEQVVDLSQSQEPTVLLQQIVPTRVCALVADRNFDRRLRYKLTMCAITGGDRCGDLTQTVIAEGLLDDPDLTIPEPQLCGVIQPDGNLLGILLDALDNDTLHGLGGLYYGVELRVGGEDADPDLDLFGSKSLSVQPKIPDTRTANTNPTISGVFAAVDAGLDTPVELVRCAETTNPLVLAPDQKVRFTPVEPDGVRETYQVPTLDGKIRTFTESLTYQWVIGDGHLSSGDTGGPHDAFGNPAPLFTDYTAPAAQDLTGTTDVPMWIVQRDERLGEAWFETCLRVTP